MDSASRINPIAKRTWACSGSVRMEQPAERLTKSDQGTAHVPHSASPDGRHLLYSVMTGTLAPSLYTVTKGTAATLWAYSFPDGKSVQLAGITSPFPSGAVFSPDGRWDFWFTADGGTERRTRVFVQPFPLTGAVYEISVGTHPAWSADGHQNEVHARSPSTMGVVTVTARPTFAFSEAVTTNVKIIAAAAATSPRAYDIGKDGAMVGAVTAGKLDASGGRAEIRWY